MQIKRFEADDMTEALRLVKREFGDDAVILSAREIRTKGFFSALRKKRVEITAAADYPPDDSSDDSDFSEMLSRQLDSDAPVDQVSLSTHGQPIRALRRSAAAGADSQRPADSGKQSTFAPADRRVGSGAPADDTPPGADRGAVGDPGQPDCSTRPSPASPVSAKPDRRWIATPFYQAPSTPRKVIALVGPSGTGKSTSVAKLARHCRVEEKMDVALISLDRFRIGANALLERVARTMEMPFAVIRDVHQLQSRLDEFDGVDVVLIDTPGLNRMEDSLMAEIKTLLSASAADEIHLVVNATVREPLLVDLTDRFATLGTNRILLTHMEEYGRDMSIANLLSRSGLPVSFYTDGTDLFDHLQACHKSGLASFLPIDADATARVTPFPRNGTPRSGGSGVPATDRSHAEVQYVANRNSELFHLPTCKSVKRINVSNIAAFESAEQAIDAGFKPCRACCRMNVNGRSKNVAVAAL